MSNAAVSPGYVPRGEERDEVSRALAGVRGLERERRMRHLVTIFMGWGMAAFMTLVALACLAVLWARPAPRDRYYVAMMHDDGTYEAPQLREDLPASQRVRPSSRVWSTRLSAAVRRRGLTRRP